jgi:hypothetical protein
LKLGCSSEHAVSVVQGVGIAADVAVMKKSSSAKSVKVGLRRDRR